MKKNMSQTDRVIRILLFTLSIALFAAEAISTPIAILLVIITGILAITSFVGYCLVYGILGWSSLRKK